MVKYFCCFSIPEESVQQWVNNWLFRTLCLDTRHSNTCTRGNMLQRDAGSIQSVVFNSINESFLRAKRKLTQKCSFLETVAAAAACDYRVPCSTCNVNTCCQRPPPKHPSLWLKSPEYTQSYAAAPFNWMKKSWAFIFTWSTVQLMHLEILGIYSIY